MAQWRVYCKEATVAGDYPLVDLLRCVGTYIVVGYSVRMYFKGSALVRDAHVEWCGWMGRRVIPGALAQHAREVAKDW